MPEFPRRREWTSGYDLAHGADVLIHDAQYTDDEYGERVGWGHSALARRVAFAELAGVASSRAVPPRPLHSDDQLDALYRPLTGGVAGFAVTPAREGGVVDVDSLAVSTR